MADELERLTSALAGRYDIRNELGRGGMATVYLAHDLKHDRPVALKVLKPDLAAAVGPERFLREIALTARLEHPHILPLLDSGEADGLLYYVMPYVQGESLRQRLNREKQLPLEDTFQITREVADALSYAHSHEIVHRDIKPENILLARGHARVADFGIARAVRAAGGEALTDTRLPVGTPAYMSPEQAAGDRAVDARSDVYSLGCVVYEMLAGQPPYTGATPEVVLARKSVEAVPSLRVVREAVPPGVEQAITKALARVPADRFATASQFAHALERGQAAIIPVTPPGRRVPRQRLVIAAAAVLVALTAGWWALTRLGPPSPRVDVLAVLPLANFTGDPGQQHFVDAMHDAMIAELAQIGALTVISRQSVLRYRETAKPIPEIARELNVDAVIEGSVFTFGDTVRITIQLLQARPAERHLWAGTFQRDLRGVLALHGEVARAIAEEVGVAVTPAELRRLARDRAVDPAAYQAWLRGWVALTSELSGPGLERCIAHAEEAAAIDPDYAPAYALAASCYNNLTYFTPTPPQDAFPRAKQAAERAIEIDPSLGTAHTDLAWALAVFEWEWSAADRAFRRAIELAPSEGVPHLTYGFFLGWMGRHEEAIEHARRAELLSPGVPVARQNVAMVLYLARRYDEAIDQAQRTIDLAPDFGFAYDRLAFAYEGKQLYDEAVAARQKVVALVGERDVRSRARLARSYGLAGRRDEAMSILADLLIFEQTSYVPPTAIALIYIALGELHDAIAWLEKGYDARDGDMILLKTWPALDPLRSDPRFQRLLRRMNFPN